MTDTSPRETLRAAWIAAGWDGDDFDDALRNAAAEPTPEPVTEPEESGIRYPDIDVTLVGVDSHPFAIIKAVTDGLRKGGIGQAERDAFREEALSGDYDHIIQTAMRWVNVS